MYQLGFLVTGLLLAVSVRLWSAVFAPLLTTAGFQQCAKDAMPSAHCFRLLR